jgi:hypothetical protein
VLLMLVVLVGALGVALGAVAWMLYQADRVARGLAYMAAAMMVGLVAFGDGTTTGDTLSMVGAIVAAAIVAFSPACQQLFSGPGSRQYGQPTSVVVARVALMIWLVLLAVVTVLYFCLADLEGRFIVYGLITAAVTAGVFRTFQRLAQPDRQARVFVTVAAAIVLVLLLVARHDTGFAYIAGLTVAIPVALWIPADARAFYGDPPLQMQTNRPGGNAS